MRSVEAKETVVVVDIERIISSIYANRFAIGVIQVETETDPAVLPSLPEERCT